MRRLSRALLASLSLISLLCLSAAPAAAQAVTRAYLTDTPLQRGMLVRITQNDKNKVEALPQDGAAKMEGVVVAANDAPVTLSDSNASQQQVFVATTGTYNILVSNQNGAVKPGDYLAQSSLAGVAMKADNSQAVVAGKALAAFDGKTNVSGTTTLKDSSGKTKTVALGLIPADISISHNPLQKPTESRIPGVAFLESGARALVNKTVDPARLYLSLVILIAVMAIAGSILFSGVRNSMVSVGRNPLARSSIMRGLSQVVIVSIIVVIVGFVGVYLLLKL